MNFCTAMASMVIGRFQKLKKEYVSDNMVLCTRLADHEGVPVTVTKAKVPFLNIDQYKGFLANFQE